jgi:hypothetical protein
MSIPRGIVGLVAICAVFLLFSLAGLAAAFMTGLLASIDGLLLVIICLMMAGLFGLLMLSIAKEQGWLPARRKQEKPIDKPSAATAPAKAAPQKPLEGK